MINEHYEFQREGAVLQGGGVEFAFPITCHTAGVVTETATHLSGISGVSTA